MMLGTGRRRKKANGNAIEKGKLMNGSSALRCQRFLASARREGNREGRSRKKTPGPIGNQINYSINWAKIMWGVLFAI